MSSYFSYFAFYVFYLKGPVLCPLNKYRDTGPMSHPRRFIFAIGKISRTALWQLKLLSRAATANSRNRTPGHIPGRMESRANLFDLGRFEHVEPRFLGESKASRIVFLAIRVKSCRVDVDLRYSTRYTYTLTALNGTYRNAYFTFYMPSVLASFVFHSCSIHDC